MDLSLHTAENVATHVGVMRMTLEVVGNASICKVQRPCRRDLRLIPHPLGAEKDNSVECLASNHCVLKPQTLRLARVVSKFYTVTINLSFGLRTNCVSTFVCHSFAGRDLLAEKG